jgi:hypothetical protein
MYPHMNAVYELVADRSVSRAVTEVLCS